MPQIDRFSVSLDTELLAAFDRHIAAKGYDNRSEAIRDMIRERLLSGGLAHGDAVVVGFLTLVCDHQAGEAAERLRSCAAGSPALILGSLNIPLDADHEAIAFAFRGPVGAVQTLADRMQAIRGIAHGKLTVVPVGA